MKINVEFELNEMDKIHNTMLEVAKEFDAKEDDIPDTLFKKRKVNLKSIKIDQQIGTIDIDIDSNFTIWCLDKLVGFSKFIRPIATFIDRYTHELRDWICPIKEVDEDEVQKEFDV